MFVKENDVFILDDKHVLMCGDSTSDDIYIALKELKKEKGNIKEWVNLNRELFMLYTDPPYNAAFNGRSGDHDVILNDSMDNKNFENFIRLWYVKMIELFGNNVTTYIWCNNYLKSVIENIDPLRWRVPNKRPIIWNKNNFGMGRNYRPKYEMLLFDGKIDSNILNESDVWDIKKDNGEEYIHPTQKPLECFARGLRNHKDILYVIDSFAGSGTSLIATEQSNKSWLGMEYDAKYVEKIIRRYYDYTLSTNIKLIRENKTYDFETIEFELKLLNGANKKGVVDEKIMRLF